MDQIGYHVSRCIKPSGSIEDNIAGHFRDLWEAKSIQIFVAGPREMTMRLDEKKKESLARFLEGYPSLFVVAHATYLDHPWNTGNVHFSQRQIDTCAEIGSSFLLHLSNHTKERVGEVLSKIRFPDAPWFRLYLETPAMKPISSVYSSAENLGDLYIYLRSLGIPVGICVDTAHIFSCGVDISDPDVCVRFFGTLLSKVPPEDLMLHLNDNANPLGGGKDKHELLFKGRIWGPYSEKKETSSLYLIFELIRRYNIHTILEIDSVSNLRYDKGIIDEFTRGIAEGKVRFAS